MHHLPNTLEKRKHAEDVQLCHHPQQKVRSLALATQWGPKDSHICATWELVCKAASWVACSSCVSTMVAAGRAWLLSNCSGTST